ncbi:MAG TPA: TlpA disulfide reductase family protein [Burkholderiales bacterium]|jgi:peroxiredoxin|nr:TlpA disulfide reductase family protein [Burkholderiales bacterium]
MSADSSKTGGRGRKIIIGALLGLVVIGLVIAFMRPAAAPQVTFTSLTGNQFSTEGLRGKVVMVNFWATDCPGCIAEMPKLVATYNKFRDKGFEMVAVAMQSDPPNYVLAYTKQNKLPFPVALDPMGKIANAFGNVQLTPTSFIIDKHGNVISRIVGEPDFTKLHALLEKHLNG